MILFKQVSDLIVYNSSVEQWQKNIVKLLDLQAVQLKENRPLFDLTDQCGASCRGGVC